MNKGFDIIGMAIDGQYHDISVPEGKITINELEEKVKKRLLPKLSESDANKALIVNNNGNDFILGNINNCINVTHQELINLRNAAQLIPGIFYRITDYECTTIQEDTRAQFWRFDIIVIADDEKTLNENARAVYHPALAAIVPNHYALANNDNDFYLEGKQTITNSYGNTKEVFVWICKCRYNGNIEIFKIGTTSDDKSTFTAYTSIDVYDVDGNYWKFNDSNMYNFGLFIDYDNIRKSHFEESNLEAWQLKYCVDGDNKRFAWAELNKTRNIIYSYNTGERFTSELITTKVVHGTTYYIWGYGPYQGDAGTLSDNPKVGDTVYIIHRSTGELMGTRNIIAITEGKGVIYYMKDEFNNECPYDFKNIQFKRWKATSDIYSLDGRYLGILDGDQSGVTIEDEDDFIWCYTFTVLSNDGDECIADNSINNKSLLYNDYLVPYLCHSNKIGQFNYPTIIDDMPVYSFRLSNNVLYVQLVDNFIFYNCYNNILNNDCCSNTFSNFYNNCYSNTFSNGCNSNIFGDGCNSNIFNEFCFNTFGNYCSNNIFGNNCFNNIFDDNCYDNIFGNNCSYNIFGTDCYYNIFGNYCSDNTFGNYYCYNIFGNKCSNNTFGSSSKDYYKYITYENGVQYTILNCTEITSSSKYCQNIHVNSGVKGSSSSNRKTLTVETADNDFITEFGMNSAGELKSWNPADLIE